MTTATATKLAATARAQFRLSDEQEETLAVLFQHDAERRKRYSELIAAAQVSPAISASLRPEVVADLGTIPAAQVRASQPSASLPAAPVVLPPPPAQAPVAFCVAPFTNVQPYAPGQILPPGCKVYFGDARGWIDYAPAAQQPQPESKETIVNVDTRNIPAAPNGKGKLPWLLSANVGGDGEIYATFGCQTGKAYNRASVRARELLAALEHADTIRAELSRLIAKLG